MTDIIARLRSATNADPYKYEVSISIREARQILAKLEDQQARTVRGYQSRVREWTGQCFGDQIDLDRPTRQAQFLEEALECVQAAGLPRATAQGLLDLVYSKPAGELNGEMGDVMTSIAAFCTAHDADMHECAEAALTRCINATDKIREKQKTKPFHTKFDDFCGKLRETPGQIGNGGQA
jgi:NTP pyrophosphatase (non-canonical NTP hydrolase)